MGRKLQPHEAIVDFGDAKILVRGFARLVISENGKIVGDSGWGKNTVTAEGLINYIAGSIGGAAGSKQFLSAQLATQTDAFNSTQQSLSGETEARKAVSPSTVGAGTFQATVSWSSTDNTDGDISLGAIGLYNVGAAGTLGAGKLFTVSTWATNQDVSATYQIRFQTTT